MTISPAELSDAKRALLAQRLQKARQKEHKPQTISRRADGEPALLSFAQRRLWFLTQWEPDNPAYNMRSVLRLSGELDAAALQQAFNEIIRRHQVLQMVYPTIDEAGDEEPVQRPQPQPLLPLPIIDLSGCLPEEQGAKQHRLAHEEVHRPFNLAQDLPIRTTLLRLSDHEHVLLLTVHHIASDEWSWHILLEELMAFYQAFHEGEAPHLSELPLQYTDFAFWQRNWLQGDVLEKQLTYWKKQLAGIPAVLELPTDRPHPPIRSHQGANHTFHLPLELSQGVQKLAQQTGVTPFMVLLATLQVLLHRYTGQDDIVIGSPIAGRNRSEIERLIGFFINTLVLRGDLSGNPSVHELLQRGRETTLAAYEHQDIPFEKLVEELQPERSLSHTPLFQVLFNYHNAPHTSLELPDLQVERIPVESKTAKFDLSLAVTETEQGIRVTFNYNVDIFNADTIQRMAAHFETVLTGMVANPAQRIADLPLLTLTEQAQLQTWNDTTVVYPPIACVHELFERQVIQNPQAAAATFEGMTYTYQELNQRANQLARHLQTLGVGPDVRVGLFIERSLDILVAMLGTLKAGGAYVPLDPIYPPDRIRFMLEDVQAPVLLTQAHLLSDLPDLGDIHLLCLDRDWETVAVHDGGNLPVTVDPANLMYLLFTSGSTGQPKGVAVEHRNFLNYIQGLLQRLDLPSGLNYALVSTFAADLGSTNVFGALCSGGRVHIISYERAADPPALADYFRQNRIDVMKLVPSHFEALQAFCGPEAFVPHHTLILAGEACPWPTMAQIRAVRPQCQLHNHYGPTETVVSALNYAVPDILPSDEGVAVPLGRPFGNVRGYVLDKGMRPLPIGIPGELYLGGPGVTRGYLNRPSRTAMSFIPDPFTAEPGARLYRTGDRVCFLPDGNIEFLGRIDHQVKIRGYRVELGEIEALIAAYPAVQDTIVILREDKPGDKRLVAYVVLQSGHNEADVFNPLRDGLREQLPGYMVPTAFVALDKLPLNANGKIERRALPPPEYSRSGSEAQMVAPRNQHEAEIAAIWADVLELEQVGIDDNFFDLGGESFKAIRVVRKIGATVSVMDLFKYPTIRELADYLAQGQPGHGGLLHELTKPIPPHQKEISLVCIPFGGGNAVVFQPLAKALPAGYSLYAVQIPGHDYACQDEPLQPMREVARQCAEEIIRDISGPIALYGHCVGGALAVEIARRLEEAGVQLEGVFMGGTFPAPRLPGKLFEWLAWGRRRRSNRATFTFLRALGGFTEGLDPAEQTFMLEVMRHDVQEVEDYYTAMYAAANHAKLKAPIISVVGEMDRVAEFYEERYQEWLFFSETVELTTIPLAGHYFLKHQAAELAHILSQKLTPPEPAPVPVAAGMNGVHKHAAASPPTPKVGTNLKTFFVVAFGQFLSMIGSNLTSFALSVWALEQTGQVSQFALINVFGRLPAILLAPLAGGIADRYDRRLVMILSDILAVLSTVLVAVLFWAEMLQIWHLYVAAAINSVANTFQEPAYTAAVTQLIPKRYLGHANGIVQFSSATGQMLALVLGGVLVVTIGLPGVFLIDFVTFIFAVSTLLFIRFPDTLFRRQEEPLIREIVRGWDYIMKRRSLVAMIIFFAIVNFLLSMVTVLTMPLVLAFETPAVLGGAAAMLGTGMLLGGVLMGLWGGTERRIKGMIGFVAVSGVASIVMGLWPSAIYAAIGFFGLGLTGALVDAHWRTLIQTKVGLELQGRVLSTNRMLALSTMPFGALLVGPLVDNVFEPLMAHDGLLAGTIGQMIGSGPGRGIALLMILVGLLRVILAVIGYSYRPLRLMEDDLPDAIPDAIIVADKDALQEQADRQLTAQVHS